MEKVVSRLQKIGKDLWLVSNYLLSRIRLRIQGCKEYGDRIYIGIGVKIRNASTISIGDSAYVGADSQIISDGGRSFIRIGQNTILLRGVMLLTQGGSISIGDHCSVNPYSILYGYGGLEIGNGVRIAAHTIIIPQEHRFDALELPIYKQGVSVRGIKIEDDVWIGANCTLMDGVKIGQGSVIGAGSVVKSDVPAYSVAVGVPARVVKQRIDLSSREIATL